MLVKKLMNLGLQHLETAESCLFELFNSIKHLSSKHTSHGT